MKEYFINLFRYETWANKEVSDCLINLSEPPEKALSQMSHIINAQEVWLSRITGKTIDVNSVWKTIPESEITSALNNSSAALREHISGLSESDIERIIEYKNIKGEEFKSSLKDILTHLSFHSAYHRGQIILLIKPNVNEIPSTDYIKYVRDNE
jgi:uncharacterized damage-inducible protein DinB